MVHHIEKNRRDWDFFRADSPNESIGRWDIKGPFRIENQRYYALIVIDDHFKIHHKLFSP